MTSDEIQIDPERLKAAEAAVAKVCATPAIGPWHGAMFGGTIGMFFGLFVGMIAGAYSEQRLENATVAGAVAGAVLGYCLISQRFNRYYNLLEKARDRLHREAAAELAQQRRRNSRAPRPDASRTSG